MKLPTFLARIVSPLDENGKITKACKEKKKESADSKEKEKPARYAVQKAFTEG